MKANFSLINVAVLLLLAAISGCKTLEPKSTKKYNVLFIAVDDLNNDISIYGNKLVKTPNLDRLAAMGVKFDKAYCQFPLCNPSRASVLTGLSPDRTKIFNLETHFRKNIPNVVTLPQLFKNNGYTTNRVGKIYHMGYAPEKAGTNWLDDSVSWHKVINPIGREVQDDDLLTNLSTERDFNYLAADGTDEEQRDGIIATEGIKMLEQSKDKPFFLALGFYRPHIPYIAPKKYFDMYPLENIQLPKEPANDLADIPKDALWTNPPHWGVKELDLRKLKQAYYASVTFMDAQLGRVLDALERLKLEENTIIVFWSDHGYNLGEHGQWMKQTLFEKSAKAPLIIAVPGYKKGQNSERTVELLDIYPTLADLCNYQPSQKLEGKSLKPLLENPKAVWNRPAYTQVSGGKNRDGRSVRTERYRYTEWSKGKAGKELYDHDKDPGEITNLADKKGYETIQQYLAKLLHKQHSN